MAKKSSKTTHVLNLLSGHDTKKEPENVHPQPSEASSVSIIDTTEADPVAEQIQENLLHELEKAAEPVPEPLAEPAPEPTAEAVPEPEFVQVNIMEEIVRDKIIYFMRQFDCCTCDRCIADAIALTLNGLMPKYIVTDPAAKDPLISFYTNRLIPDITVEATKACMIIKENPRHKPNTTSA